MIFVLSRGQKTTQWKLEHSEVAQFSWLDSTNLSCFSQTGRQTGEFCVSLKPVSCGPYWIRAAKSGCSSLSLCICISLIPSSGCMDFCSFDLLKISSSQWCLFSKYSWVHLVWISMVCKTLWFGLELVHRWGLPLKSVVQRPGSFTRGRQHSSKLNAPEWSHDKSPHQKCIM